MNHELAALFVLVAGCGKADTPVAEPSRNLPGRSVAPILTAADGPMIRPSLPESEPIASSSPSLREELAQYVEREVAMGFSDRDTIVEGAVAIFQNGEPLVALATLLTDEALEVHRQREVTWSEPTDCDRLDHVFARIEEQGIVARQKWSDCSTCGSSEIRTEMESLIADGRTVRGYVFYHDQDLENAPDGAMYLSYGSSTDDPQSSVAIGREIVKALDRAGLETSWDGRIETRIGLINLQWQRRRFTESPPV